MNRPLRSLMIGDTDHYFSPYIFGVAHASARLGIWHTQISIRLPLGDIAKRVEDVRPDLIWTQMLLWPPPGSPRVDELLSLCAEARPARVVIHDGDAKENTRHPHNISSAVDLALVNHGYDRSQWKVDVMSWPYAAFDQDSIPAASAGFVCDLAFAGQAGGNPLYSERAATIEKLLGRDIDFRVFSSGNTMLQTPQLAASARSVLGFGRPEVKGWVDTRVFQYPGAGGVLLHDDVGGYLEPEMFVQVQRYDVESIIEAVKRLHADSARSGKIRQLAFTYVQAYHSYSSRVRAVLERLSLT